MTTPDFPQDDFPPMRTDVRTEYRPGPQYVIQDVRVVDIDVKFGSMVWLVMKFAVASLIPAAIMWFIVWVALAFLFATGDPFGP